MDRWTVGRGRRTHPKSIEIRGYVEVDGHGVAGASSSLAFEI